MSPKHKLITLSWCVVTMIATMVLSHGHLIMKEVLSHWPTEDSWEARFENALYTQGGLAVVASLLFSGAMFARSYFANKTSDEQTRRELAVRERHERAAAARHDALLSSLSAIHSGSSSSTKDVSLKKSQDSGVRPR